MTLAHVASVPLEELLLLAPAASALWLAIRAGAHAGPHQSTPRVIRSTGTVHDEIAQRRS
jgi:hypothetical protein